MAPDIAETTAYSKPSRSKMRMYAARWAAYCSRKDSTSMSNV